jgi:hypothetical protein
MGKDEYVVVAPYVTLKVKDGNGGVVVRGFNEGAVVKAEDVDEANLRHHVETRLLAPKGHPDAEFAGPAGTPKPGEPPNVPVTEGSQPARSTRSPGSPVTGRRRTTRSATRRSPAPPGSQGLTVADLFDLGDLPSWLQTPEVDTETATRVRRT